MRYLCLALMLFATPAATTENTSWECGKPRDLAETLKGAIIQVHIYGRHGWSIEVEGLADPVKERITYRYSERGLEPLLNGKACRFVKNNLDAPTPTR